MGFDLGTAQPVQAPSQAPATGGFDLASAKPVEDYSPTSGMSTFEKARAGYGKAAVDLLAGAKQRWDDAAAWLEGHVPFAEALNRTVGGKSAAAVRDEGRAAEDERKHLDSALMNDTAGRAGNVTGNVVNAIPAAMVPGAGTLAGSAAIGGALGALQPTGSDESAVHNTLWGAAGGAAGSALLKGAAKVVKPVYSSAVNKLLDAGVPLTPGQMLGGAWKRIEDAVTSIPVAGDAIRSAQKRAFQAFNTAVGNEALNPIGTQLPKGLSGHDAVMWTRKALGGAYDDVLQRIGNVQADAQFGTELASLRAMVQNGNMAPAAVEQFDKILQNQVTGRFQGQASITAQTMKKMESDLGNLSDRLSRTNDFDKQLLGDAVEELQGTLRNLVQRAAGPTEAADLQAANHGWAMFTRMRRAASMVGANEGTFTPAQYLNATKALDKSTAKGAFSEGRALGQDLAVAGKSALGETVPDSGTAMRSMVQHPVAGTAMLAASLPAAAVYSQPVQNVARMAMTMRPAAAGPMSKALQALSPLAGSEGGMLLPRMSALAPGNGQ